MSLDVGGTLAWGWLLVNDEHAQAIIAQPLSTLDRHTTKKLLRQWISILQGHGDLPKDISLADSEMKSWDLPLAGALAHEGIGNRTLLIGPAGGFYSACGEDIYPNCWSAFFAADVLRTALREKHLQDAINQYRMVWRTTLGDYLRGSQQNLRFLLPLMYRNQTMTTRLAGVHSSRQTGCPITSECADFVRDGQMQRNNFTTDKRQFSLLVFVPVG